MLDQILEQYRVVQHGVSMYFGSAEPLEPRAPEATEGPGQRTKTPWLSDHLCWGSVDGRYTHDLLPMPYTFEAAAHHRAKRSARCAIFSKCRCGRKRQQLRRVSRLGNDRVGVSHRGGRAGRLRHSARREQHLRLVEEPQLRSRSTYVNSVPAPSRGADPHRRPHEIREIHSRHARSSGARSGLEALRARHRTRRPRRRRCSNGTTSIPSFDEVHDEALKANKLSSPRSLARHRRMTPPEHPAPHGSRGDAAAHSLPKRMRPTAH